MGGEPPAGEHHTMDRLAGWQVAEDFRVLMHAHRLLPSTAPRVSPDAQRSLYALELLHILPLVRLGSKETCSGAMAATSVISESAATKNLTISLVISTSIQGRKSAASQSATAT
jgi:hypothetical protein